MPLDRALNLVYAIIAGGGFEAKKALDEQLRALVEQDTIAATGFRYTKYELEHWGESREAIAAQAALMGVLGQFDISPENERAERARAADVRTTMLAKFDVREEEEWPEAP